MIAIIKYNAGNIRSVENALAKLNVDYLLTDDPDQIRSADKVIFPGVGAAGSAMQHLRRKELDQVIIDLKQPFLGICLGMQLMCAYSEEEDTPCLGIFQERVKRFPFEARVPHMGWNDFIELKGNLFTGIDTNENMYFVHSYYVERGYDTNALTEYIFPFSSGVQKDNFYGVQFHPEKSANSGYKLLKNFMSI